MARLTFLIIDDSPDTRKGHNDVHVRIAELVETVPVLTVEAALEVIASRRHEVDLVILDCAMTGRDELDAVLRIQQELPGVPIRFITHEPTVTNEDERRIYVDPVEGRGMAFYARMSMDVVVKEARRMKRVASLF